MLGLKGPPLRHFLRMFFHQNIAFNFQEWLGTDEILEEGTYQEDIKCCVEHLLFEFTVF